jgi:hypothetical protein
MNRPVRGNSGRAFLFNLTKQAKRPVGDSLTLLTNPKADMPTLADTQEEIREMPEIRERVSVRMNLSTGSIIVKRR